MIPNSSFPYGVKVNGNVCKRSFEGGEFTHKFLLIDDIFDKILNTKDPVHLKIDIACAFSNLGGDPADLLIFGIKWNHVLMGAW